MEEKKHSLIPGITVFAILTILMVIAVCHMDPKVWEIMKLVSPKAVFWLLVLDFIYHLAESEICRSMLKDRIEGFGIREALDVTYTGVFANVATLSGGVVPMQSYYLHRQGMMVGSGVGVMSLEYIFHKASIIFYSTFVLILGWNRIKAELPVIAHYLLTAYLVCLAIVVFLILICVWRRMQAFALWGLEKLPDTGKWTNRKFKIQQNVEALYRETRALIHNRKNVFKIFLLEMGKLTVFCVIPFACARVLKIQDVSLLQILSLSALMFLITNAIPNVAGMGPAEFSFLLVFSGCMGDSALSALMLYRLVTYYIPFLVSSVWVLCIQHRLMHRNTPAASSPF